MKDPHHHERMYSVKPYSLAIHVERLESMLELIEPCDSCPATFMFEGTDSPFVLWTEYPSPCQICQEFVGLKFDTLGYPKCPCRRLDSEEAIARTTNALVRYRAENP